MTVHANGEEWKNDGTGYSHHEVTSDGGSITSRVSKHDLADLHGLPGLPEGKKVNIHIKRNHHTKRKHTLHHGHHDGEDGGR